MKKTANDCFTKTTVIDTLHYAYEDYYNDVRWHDGHSIITLMLASKDYDTVDLHEDFTDADLKDIREFKFDTYQVSDTAWYEMNDLGVITLFETD